MSLPRCRLTTRFGIVLGSLSSVIVQSVFACAITLVGIGIIDCQGQMADMAAVKVGKELGLSGDDLRMYVENQQEVERQRKREEQEYERERRAHEREMKRLELEISEKKLKAESQGCDEKEVKRDSHLSGVLSYRLSMRVVIKSTRI